MLKGTDFSWIGTGSEYDESNAIVQAKYVNTCAEYRGNYNIVFASKKEGYYILNHEDIIAAIRYENQKEWKILPSPYYSLTVSDIRVIDRILDAIDSMGGLRKEWIFPK